MTKIYNDPADFSGEALSGFAAAFPKYVQQVPGGLVRAGPPTPGKVAVVVGGGTGDAYRRSGSVAARSWRSPACRTPNWIPYSPVYDWNRRAASLSANRGSSVARSPTAASAASRR